ncbi:MAG: restriction endonuclease subunit S [Desulfuromonadales bacterium]
MSFEAGTYQIDNLINAGLLEISDGYRAKNSELSPTGIPFARAGNIKDGFKFDSADYFPVDKIAKVGNKVSRPGDVVFTSKGTVGRFALVLAGTQRFVYSPQLCFWRSTAQDKLLPEYLYYWMNSTEFLHQISYLKGQTDMADYVSLRDQRKIKVTIPETAIQRFIVEILKPLDDRITLLRETNTTLEAIAQALFKSWFVDFDPVRAKQEGREPEGMNADTAALFPDSFEESELGLAPKGWRIGTVADLAKLNPESWTTKNHPETVRYIDLANAKMNDIEEITEYAFDDAPSRARRVLRAGDSILGTVRPGNRSFAFIYQALNNLTGSTGFAVLRPINVQSEEFVFIATTQDSSIDYLAHVADGGAYPAVRPEVIANIQSILPSDDVMCAFHNVVAPLFARIGKNKLQAQTLTTLRDTLLPRLISGQLRLPDAEALVEEVAE